LDNSGAKLGFVAWEGDASIANLESLLINGNPLSDPWNPSDNAFNGTNNIIGSDTLFNMDLDVYNIQSYIAVGNTSATIKMTTAQDFVLINAIVTKLNSQLPDATVTINTIELECDSRTIVVDYTVSNFNSTNPLPPGTPIALYVDGIFTAFDETTLPIDIGASMNFQLSMVIPETVPPDFDLTVVVDDTGNGNGIVAELNEANNTAVTAITLWLTPPVNPLPDLVACNEGFTQGTFDFSSYGDLVRINPEDNVRFYQTPEDAAADVNPILNTTNYVAVPTPQEIFVRVSNEHCFAVTSFLLTTRNCPPTVYNYVSANNDSANDTFTIAGLRNIFLNFRLEVYNRWGRLLWSGTNDTEDWDGYVKDGFGSKKASDGTFKLY
jgi:gliding motility-associated-like protein